MNPADILRTIDSFMQTEIEARALSLAFELGLIERLAQGEPVGPDDLRAMAKMPERGFALFLQILAGNDVVRGREEIGLSLTFRKALAYRDLMEAKLWFANLVSPDIHELFGELLSDIRQFMARAKVFELFRYDRCLEVTPDNVEATRRWVAYTTMLTRYEAPACLERLALAGHRRMLDAGGNSGEFSRQACARNPRLEATVFDLPVVCALGREHVAAAREAPRISFREGDLRADALPGGHDLISFKSVLHDWPQDRAESFLKKAADALEPGGRLVIFERAPIETRGGRLGYAMVANLVFLSFFRPAEVYTACLAELGLIDIEVETVELETPFFLVTARKPV